MSDAPHLAPPRLAPPCLAPPRLAPPRLARTPRVGRAPLWCAALFAFVALGADFLASGRPVLARLRGELRFFPNLTRPSDVPGDLDGLQAVMTPGDWYVSAPVPYAPEQSRSEGEVRALRAPSSQHWLGTDRAGCDVLARLIHGARTSLGIGLLTALFALGAGVALGALAGAGGRVADALCSRVAETFSSFPPLVLLCALQAFTLGAHRGAASIVLTALALAAAGWPHYYRLVRASVRSARAQEYAVAAVALGVSPLRLAVRHLLPAAWPQVATAAAFTVPSAILLEASLAYLGVGPSVDLASWGELLHQAGFGGARWWLIAFPGLAIFLAAGSLLWLADGVRNALDPRPTALRSLR